jgi:colanic acid biosynthesis glycosyl transferase WcaI
MRILMVGINFWPEPTGIGKYSGELAEYLCKTGHQVTVITAPPYYPYWRVQVPYHQWHYQRENWKGVNVIRCPLFVPAKVTGINRIVHLLSFSLSALPVILCEKSKHPDLIFSLEPSLFTAALTPCNHKKYHILTWIHIQDFELDAALGLGLLKHVPFIEKIVRAWESHVYRRFGVISTISHAMMNRLFEKQVKIQKIHYFPNWIDTSLIHPLQGENRYRKELHFSSSDTVILYSGSIGKKQGIEILIEAMKNLTEQKTIHLVICGEGPGKTKLKEAAVRCDNIHFLPVQPVESLNELLNMANIHVLPQKAGVADLVMPSKLLGMLASGKPVIALANPGTELAEVLENIGMVFSPEDTDHLVKAIQKLSENHATRIKMGEHGLAWVKENWSKEKVLGDFSLNLEKEIEDCKRNG